MFIKTLLVAVFLSIGFLLKKLNILKINDSKILLNIVFFIALPALIFNSFSKDIPLTASNIPLVLSSIFILPICLTIAYIFKNIFNLPQSQQKVFLISTMIANTGFIIPYVKILNENTGLTYLFLIDIFNGILAYTVAYYISSPEYQKNNFKSIFLNLIKSPPLITIIFSILINLYKINIPEEIYYITENIASLVVPLILISLGLCFNFSLSLFNYKVITPVAIRIFIGLITAIGYCYMFNLEGLMRNCIIIFSAAPVGYNTVIFANIKNLDTEYATNIISLSIMLSIPFLPVLLTIIK